MILHPLRTEREGRGWSQAKIAKALGISTRTVSRWEQGLAVPHPYYREQLSCLFGKTVEELKLLPDADENDALEDLRLLPDANENDVLEEVSSSLAESDVPDILGPMSVLVEPSIPQTLRDENRLPRHNDLLMQMKLRPLKRFSWHSLLMVSITCMCVLVMIVLLLSNKPLFPSSSIPTTDLRVTHTTIIDDSVQGTDVNQFNYVGDGWGHCPSPNSVCGGGDPSTLYNLSNSWDAIINDYMILSFTGTQISFYGVLDPKHGIGAVSLDGGTETMIDFYAARRVGNQLLWTSPRLPAGTHTFKLRVTGEKSTNAGATGAFVVIDRVDILS